MIIFLHTIGNLFDYNRLFPLNLPRHCSLYLVAFIPSPCSSQTFHDILVCNMAHINNYIEGTIWADWWNRWCCRTNEAEFRKTLVYYTDGCRNWNGYTMAVRSTQVVAFGRFFLIQLKEIFEGKKRASDNCLHESSQIFGYTRGWTSYMVLDSTTWVCHHHFSREVIFNSKQ